MTEPRAAIVSAALAPLLDGPAQVLRVAHRTSLAWQLVDDHGHVVACLTFPGAIRLPHAVAVAEGRWPGSRLGSGDGTLSWDDQPLRIARWWRPASPHLPALHSRIRDDAVGAFAGTWRDSLGSGDGLTPYADDVLCGVLATLHAARHPAAVSLSREVLAAPLERLTTAASAGLLRQAAAGWCLDEVAAVLRAYSTGHALDEASAALVAVGHSSGRGLLEGISTVLAAAMHEAIA